MPDVEGGGLFGSAIRAAAEGLSANAWLRSLAEAGAGVRRAVGLQLYAQARAVAAEAGEEPTRPLDQIPTLGESPPTPTRNSEGLLQTVRLVYREKVTGNLRVVYHSTVSEAGITRQQAIDNAIDAYASHSEEYQTTLVGAAHTSSRRLTPAYTMGSP
jgi:hypothetical protein